MTKVSYKKKNVNGRAVFSSSAVVVVNQALNYCGSRGGFKANRDFSDFL